LNPIKIPEMVLVDVDGTMVNSVPDLAYSIDQMLLDLDMPVRGEDKVRHWVGE
jgi:phosphoglycolate phosphatase